MNVSRLLVGCVMGALLPADSAAQACRGRPGFAKAMVVANAGVMMAEDARSTSVGLTTGSRGEGLVASVAAGHVVREDSPTFDSEQTGTSLGASLAYAGTEGKDGRLALCPGVGISRVKVSGSAFGATATLTQTTRRVGLSAGYTFGVSPDLSVIPFASIDWVRLGGSFSGNGTEFLVPDDTYYPIGVGLGIVLRERFGLTASAIIPTGIPTGHTSFVMSLSAALGRR